MEAIELEKSELEILEIVAKQDWSKVRPAIFGNIFEVQSMNSKDINMVFTTLQKRIS